ncbi:Tim44 domain-containing protein [Caldimonas tepidiphila]|uniref:Tim44 domain-containing protein n=1 Tax=Caldimonas tepidiphila TaxID=2315841 RepID=UPI000E5C0F99|nr:TIM44-like domain-containing protein [Caldimonas tepidiphila]
MKKMFVGAMVALMAVGMTATSIDVEAKRLGGGGSSGMSRQTPARQAPTNPPPQQHPAQNNAAGQNTTNPGGQAPASPAAAAPVAGAAAGAAAQGARRSWMGPIAGLAAGLGLAALASHLGFGEELANFMMLMLIGIVAFALIAFLVRRFAANKAQGARGMQYAGAGAPMGNTLSGQDSALQRSGTAMGGSYGSPAASTGLAAAPLVQTGAPSALPADFDRSAFERVAKLIFIRLQAANDAGDLEDLRRFTTPEMFAAARLDIQDRRGGAQQTDVVQLDAEVVDFARESDREVVSVRYHGLIREEANGTAQTFDEIWHLVRPADGSREWAIAGIQQSA